MLMVEEIKFTKIKYETIEFEDDSENVIGSVLLYNKKVSRAELYDTTIVNKEGINKVRKFLDEIEEMKWINH